MATATETTSAEETKRAKAGFPWWLVLIEGILAIIVGLLLLVYPVKTFVALSFFVGIWWFINGIFDIVMIFFDHSMWGWKLFMGIVGIIAGAFLFNEVLRGAVTLAYVTTLFIGFMGLFYGILGIIRGFQGGGWGAVLLGAVSVLFGILILTNVFATSLALPWVFGIFAIIGGIGALFMAFRLRSA
ncbi:MAG: conserved rane protein of unknown function [Chloroflexi bacterium]|nr:conserved rane protein of unknown function [Chloroflexota bacterium]